MYAESETEALLETIEENRAALDFLRAELEREIERQASTKKLERLENEISSISQAWPYLSELERQQIIRDCVEKIVITGNNVEIFYAFDGLSNDSHVA